MGHFLWKIPLELIVKFNIKSLLELYAWRRGRRDSLRTGGILRNHMSGLNSLPASIGQLPSTVLSRQTSFICAVQSRWTRQPFLSSRIRTIQSKFFGHWVLQQLMIVCKNIILIYWQINFKDVFTVKLVM